MYILKNGGNKDMTKNFKKDVIECIKVSKLTLKLGDELPDDERFYILNNDNNWLYSEDITSYKEIKVSDIKYCAFMSGYICIDSIVGNFNNCDDYWNHIDNIYKEKLR